MFFVFAEVSPGEMGQGDELPSSQRLAGQTLRDACGGLVACFVGSYAVLMHVGGFSNS